MNAPDPAKPKWYYGWGSVIAALLLTGPLAFPLLWKSPRFTRTGKILLTAAFTALTIYLIVAPTRLLLKTIQDLKQQGLL